MWWNKCWGKWRYDWLRAEVISAIFYNRNVDHLYLRVFSTLDLDTGHAERDLDLLLEILQMRQVLPLFRINTICDVASRLNASSHPKAWRIVYEMARMLMSSSGCYYNESIRDIMEKLKDKMFPSGERVYGLCSQTKNTPCFPFVLKLFYIVRHHLDASNYDRSFDYEKWTKEKHIVDFEPELQDIIMTADTMMTATAKFENLKNLIM